MNSTKRTPIRYVVVGIEKKMSPAQLELTLHSAISINEQTDQYKCILKDFWFSTPIQVGNYVNVFDAKVEPPVNDSVFIATLTVDNASGLVVLNPDTLISTTTLMSASSCMRRAWLSRLFDCYGKASKALLIGTVVHELFQASLLRNLVNEQAIKQLYTSELLPQFTLELYSLGLSQSDFLVDIAPYFKSISSWLQLYTNKDAADNLFAIQRLHEIENSIWSTKYGFIGKIDVSLEVTINDKINMVRSRNLIPLELKTGHHTFSSQHIGQVILYSFIMAEKYPNLKPTDGFLVYLKDTPKTELVKRNHNVFRDLIILRNSFIQYYDKLFTTTLQTNINLMNVNAPDPLNNERICSRCEHLDDCSLVYRCFEASQPGKANLELVNTTVAHLDQDELDFFANIISLLEIEKQSSIDKTVHFWNIRSEECESYGIGVSKMQIKYQAANMISFERCTKLTEQLPYKLLNFDTDFPVNYSLLEERRVVISEELRSSKRTFEIYGSFCKQLCMALGYIKGFSNDFHSIEIELEKNQLNQLNPNAIYRVDFLKNISSKAMLINFSNILRLMSSNDDRLRELRQIIIRGHFPKNNLNTSNVTSYARIFNSPFLSKLNVQQKKAILGVLKTKCALIFGSPGSGKTQTIVALVQTLCQLGHSVLVTSYTHVAVDNILLKLVQANQSGDYPVDFVRIGQRKRIHPELKEYSDHHRTKSWLDTGDLNSLTNFYSTVPVVAATCLAINSHPLFTKRHFDYCILDEASQVFLSTSLGPIFQCKNFVLVGDQKQLPPVIKNQYARKQGLGESLFARLLTFADKEDILSSREEDAFERFEDYLSKHNVNRIDSVRVFPLFIQYRMNRVIMELANKLTYSGKLKCATTDIEHASLAEFLPSSNTSLQTLIPDDGSCLHQAISPLLEDSVIFLDTDGVAQAAEICISEQETACFTGNVSTKVTGGYVFNDFEASIIVRLVHSLLMTYQKGGLHAENIGIISPFQRQVVRIRELLGEAMKAQKSIEINTVDQYQGRDKEVIIYSCVKSFIANAKLDCPSQQSVDTQGSSLSVAGIVDSELLKDERRLNVAITRAKKKLIIIGNRSTLNRYMPFKNLFDVLESRQYVSLKQFYCEHNQDHELDLLNDINFDLSIFN